MEWRDIEELLGHTVISIDFETYDDDIEEVKFKRSDGKIVKMYHDQDCCECVYLHDVDGDWNDILGSPLVEAEEASREAVEGEEVSDCGTWTYYKLGTVHGSISLRWLGESNGFYSEEVNIKVIDQ